MISVSKTYQPIPKSLKDNKIGLDVNEELTKIYHSKCAFCESKIDVLIGSLEIDHYRPKSIYPWLSTEWSNLILICNKCNKHKSSRFPIENEENRISEKPKNIENNINSNFYKNELPLLLNPEIDNPDNHIHILFSGEIKSITSRGERTINICNLSRFNTRRKELIDKFVERFRKIYLKSKISDNEANFELLFNELISNSQPSSEYSKLWNDFHNNFTEFCEHIELLKDIPEVRKLIVHSFMNMKKLEIFNS